MKQIIFFILLLSAVVYAQPIDTTSTGGTGAGLSQSAVEAIVGDSTYALRLIMATDSELNLKAPIASPTFTGTVTLSSPFTIGTTSVTTTGAQLNYLNSTTSNVQTQLNAKEGTITAGTSLQYFRGDKTWATLNATAVGLGNVTNESKATMFTSPTFTTSVVLPSTITWGGTLSLIDGTELNYLNNVTSNIQTQLNSKFSKDFTEGYTITNNPTNNTVIPIMVGGANGITELSKLPVPTSVVTLLTSKMDRFLLKSTLEIVDVTEADTFLVFWTDSAIVIDSIKYIVDDTNHIQIFYANEGDSLFNGFQEIVGSGALSSFANTTIDADEMVYLIFSTLGNEAYKTQLKIYWRYQ